jgi:nitrous oxide reductase
MSNSINELFIIAARKKFRFNTSKGSLNCEDLFDLNLPTLDNIAVALDEEIQKAGRKSFVQKRTNSTTNLEIQLEIVKFVIETKQAEAEERKTKEANEARRAFLLDLKNKKALEQLEGLSLEEIDEQIAGLG